MLDHSPYRALSVTEQYNTIENVRVIATMETIIVAAIGTAATAATQKRTFRIAQTANVATQKWSPMALVVDRAGTTFTPATAFVTMPTTSVLAIGTAVIGETLLPLHTFLDCFAPTLRACTLQDGSLLLLCDAFVFVHCERYFAINLSCLVEVVTTYCEECLCLEQAPQTRE